MNKVTSEQLLVYSTKKGEDEKDLGSFIFTKDEQGWRVSLPPRREWKQKAASRLSVNSWCWKTRIMSLSTRCCCCGRRRPATAFQATQVVIGQRAPLSTPKRREKKKQFKIISHCSPKQSSLNFLWNRRAWCSTVNYSCGDKKKKEKRSSRALVHLT